MNIENIIKEQINKNLYKCNRKLYDKHRRNKKIETNIQRQKDFEFERNLFCKFKITVKQYEELLKKQNGLCAICKQVEKAKSKTGDKIKRLAVDHCHKTNKIRGLLCQDCNTMLGKSKDNVLILESAIQYLKES